MQFHEVLAEIKDDINKLTEKVNAVFTHAVTYQQDAVARELDLVDAQVAPGATKTVESDTTAGSGKNTDSKSSTDTAKK